MPTALIAEDEPLLAAALAAELARAWPALHIVATVGDGISAVRETLALKPDVLLLDIRMPGMSGLDAAAELADAWDDRSAPFPVLVFVTAYDQYAVQAFETQAVDYILKPVRSERLEKSIKKMQLALFQRAQKAPDNGANSTSDALTAARQLRALLDQWQPPPAPTQPPLRQLPVSPAGTGGALIRMVPVDQVLLLQAADKYVRVVTADGEHLLRTPLREVLTRLDADLFWQIHRNTAVRADAIESVQRDEAGRLRLHLRGHGESLPVSRLYAGRFKAL